MTNLHSTILSALKEPVAVFTDFDGTLVDIAQTPDAVHVPDNLVARLETLSDTLSGAFAIVTGRMIAEVDLFLTPANFSIAGSHGAEHRHADQTLAPTDEVGTSAQTIADELTQVLGTDTRILIEKKHAGVAAHYRKAPEREDDVRSAIEAAVAELPDFTLVDGKKVIEARASETNKGDAVRRLMRLAPFRGRLPIFLGDDVTDEDGFAAVQDLGGFGIKIGDGPTAALYRLPDVAAARALLDGIAQHSAGRDRTGSVRRDRATGSDEAMVK